MSCPLCIKEIFKPVGSKNEFELFKCQNCKLIFVHPEPNQEQLQNIYNDYDETEKYLKKLNKKRLTSKFKLKRISKFLSISQNKFLDVGCNIGATVIAAHNLGFQSSGIDLDKKAIKKAKELFKDCQFDSITTQDLVKSNKKFDLIYCAEVIEHIVDIHSFMESLSNLTNPNGVLYLTTPDAGHIRVPKKIANWKEVKPPEHIRFFNKKNMKKLLQTYQFKIEKLYCNHRANLRVIARKT